MDTASRIALVKSLLEADPDISSRRVAALTGSSQMTAVRDIHKIRGNVSDVSLGNVSDVSLGNVSDVSLGNVSDVSLGNVSDVSLGNVSDVSLGNVSDVSLGTIMQKFVDNNVIPRAIRGKPFTDMLDVILLGYLEWYDHSCPEECNKPHYNDEY